MSQVDDGRGLVLEPGRAAASELHQRMIFAVGPEREAVIDALTRLPNVAVRQPGPDVIARGGVRVVGDFLMGAGAGIANLASAQEFMSALRELLDAPFLRLLTETRRELVLDPSPTDPTSDALRAAVWPDGWPVAAVTQLGSRAPSPSVAPTPPGPVFDGGLVLVLGAPRSGTTWLTQLLLAHPETCGAGEAETWLFRSVADFWSNKNLQQWLPPDTLTAALRRFCNRLLGAARAGSNPEATHFVEKTPVHVWHLDQITTLYPEVRIVHIVRDGRDVARSLAEISIGTETVAEGARGWREYVETAHAQLRSRDHLEVRYEDLLADPPSQAARILTWVGLEVDDNVRDAIGRRAGTRVSQHGTTGPVGSGKWRQLDDDDVHAVWREAGGLLDALGYGSAPNRRRWPRRRRRSG
jgi:LPS sulfotransferase NodH